MVLTRLDPQTAQSTEGFTLRSRDRHYYEYSEDGRVMRVVVDPSYDASTGTYSEVVSEASLKSWQPPFEGELISAETRDRIKQNVSAALTFLRIPHRFE
jgi:hypothetical protein